ncbi:MAG: DUF4097 domain-containing protein [Balneolaceae bacterium]|nr:DUF4097 domain-containing protein [Balneolaceae bacterium]
MKVSKIILPIVMLFLAYAQTANAQTYQHQISNSADQSIEIVVTQSDLYIEGYDGNEVVIENMDYEEPPARAEGLRSLYSSGEDNTGIGLSVEEENGTLKIYPANRSGGDFKIKVPNKVRIKVEEVNWGGGDFEIKNHSGEIEFKTNTGDMLLENITGPVVASSTSGDIKIIISSLMQQKPSSISLVSGDIDITMPENSKVDFSLYTVTGDVFTDLQIDVPNKVDNMKRLSGGKIEGSMNGGGVEVSLKSVSGDIYLRKK